MLFKKAYADNVDKNLMIWRTVRTLEKEYNADRNIISHWIRDYNELGEKALDLKGHKGNTYAVLHTSNVDNIPLFIENYVHYFSKERLSYKLNYNPLVQYKIEQGFG